MSFREVCLQVIMDLVCRHQNMYQGRILVKVLPKHNDFNSEGHLRPTAMGPQKYENEQISATVIFVVSALELWEQKKTNRNGPGNDQAGLSGRWVVRRERRATPTDNQQPRLQHRRPS